MPPSASALLTEELKKKVREHGIVVFLDPERHYTGLVSQLARPGSAFDYGVVSYQDSFLELMLSLERYGCGLEKDLLLLHLPGISKETVKSTPVLELYEAGTVHERALSTLVREAAVGAASPPEIDGFLRTPGLTLEVADAWLAGLDAAPRDELESLLETVGIEQVVIQLVATGGRHHAALVKEPERLLPFLAKHLGLTEAWRLARVGEGPLSPHGLARLVATWLMAVEFVHDLQEPPVHEDLRPLKGLGAFAKECKRLAALVRDELTDEYEEQSQALQGRADRRAREPQGEGARLDRHLPVRRGDDARRDDRGDPRRRVGGGGGLRRVPHDRAVLLGPPLGEAPAHLGDLAPRGEARPRAQREPWPVALRLARRGRRALHRQARPARSAAPAVRAGGAPAAVLGSRGPRQAARGAPRRAPRLPRLGRRPQPRVLRAVREARGLAAARPPAAGAVRRRGAAARRARRAGRAVPRRRPALRDGPGPRRGARPRPRRGLSGLGWRSCRPSPRSG